MSLALHTPTAPSLSEQQQYRLIYAATFMGFLGVVAVKRAYRRLGGSARPAGARQSLYAEAKATGYSTLALAFMG